MLSAILLLLFCAFILFFISNYQPRSSEEEVEEIRKNPQIKKLWGLAQSAIKERKPLKAEKALLTILRFDEKNAAAYNRLGILYAKEKHYKQAVECFEIAQSLDNNASSLHNVGLIYFETGKYEKAAMAFSQAIEIEGDQPGRYIAYAKALEKLGERAKAVEALETAYSLNPSAIVLRHILEIYENAGDENNAEATRKRIEDLQAARAAVANRANKAREAERQKRIAQRKAQREARVANRAQASAKRRDAKIARQTARTQQRAVAQNRRIVRPVRKVAPAVKRPISAAKRTTKKISIVTKNEK